MTTYGARAALRVDLNDNWTVTPVLMAQKTKAGGFFSSNPALGEYKVAHFSPDDSEDQWADAALTLEGKISNFDLTYAGSFLKRNDESRTDYSDYSLAYDISIPSYTDPIVDNSGNHINPTQWILAKDRYQKVSQELRLSTPKEWRFRAVAGVVLSAATARHRAALRDSGSGGFALGHRLAGHLVAHGAGARRSRRRAFFIEGAVDITDQFSFTAGLRRFKYDNTLEGFRGFGIGNPLGVGSGLGEGRRLRTGGVPRRAVFELLQAHVRFG